MTNVEKGKKGFVEIDARVRFEAKVDKSAGPDACWPWLGATDGKGRGQIWIDGRNRRAPRIAWSLHNGADFPEKLLACHTCDNPNCVNPAHIFVGSMSDNITDAVKKGRHKAPALPGWQGLKTECKRGHPFTPENTHTDSKGRRKCRTCQRMHNENHRKQNAAL